MDELPDERHALPVRAALKNYKKDRDMIIDSGVEAGLQDALDLIEQGCGFPDLIAFGQPQDHLGSKITRWASQPPVDRGRKPPGPITIRL